jgi:ribosomal protein L16 Arg81 hydroxylase
MQILSLVFDFVLLVLLVATIAYAARLSLVLRRFKENRDILDRMIKDLNKNVNDAEQVITKLQNTADTSGRELQRVIDKAGNISDELSLMTEAGDNLANRLEKLADRKGGGERDPFAGMKVEEPSSRAKPASKAKSKRTDISEKQANKEAESFLERVFAIRDPDIERGDNPLEGIDPLDSDDDFHSEAERDLLNALQGKNK